MKLLIILSALTLSFVVVESRRMKKCYYIIYRCPRITDPCPKPAICLNGTLREEEDGCCCVPKCLENEVFYDQATISADPTCDIQVPFPSPMGGPSGCFCKPGFVRNEHNKCVHLDECPKPISACNKNETYTKCGQIEACEASCKNPLPHGMCPAICKKGCYCKDEYVRDKDRNCILLEDCPDPECGKNEEYLKCNSNCGDPTCDIPRVYYCGYQCRKGCFCQKGFVRNKERECVRLDQCPNHDEL